MSTISREFTKEQLIAKAREQIEFCRNTKITGEGRVHVNQCLALFEIALASLEAEPVGTFRNGPCGYSPSFHEDAVPLYTAPPAPVSVPDAMEMDDDFDSAFEHGKAVGWNACRTAMLQGAEPVSNRDELPERWVACSERMPEGMQTVITSNGFDIGQGWWDGDCWQTWTYHDDVPGDITHWMPLPAAPQPEAE